MPIETDIKNYYEDLVVEEILKQAPQAGVKPTDYEDVACVALNTLPPRYYRYSVDMAFYLSQEEHIEMNKRVENAVSAAIEKVSFHRQGREAANG